MEALEKKTKHLLEENKAPKEKINEIQKDPKDDFIENLEQNDDSESANKIQEKNEDIRKLSDALIKRGLLVSKTTSHFIEFLDTMEELEKENKHFWKKIKLLEKG